MSVVTMAAAVTLIDKVREKVGKRAEEELDALEELLRAYEPEKIIAYPDYGLTRMQSRLFHILLKHEGKVVHKEVLSSFLYYDRHPDERADPNNVISVMVCKMRPLLFPHGFTIETAWGVGFRLLRV